MYELAPLSESYDMFVALGFCYLPIIVWIVFAIISSNSGSIVKEQIPGSVHNIRWVKSDKNVPFIKNGWFHFALVWFVLGSIFFWLILWPDHYDVWFIIK
jgi:hypothetical protein